MTDSEYYAFFLVGSTAVGKTAIAHWIAEKRGLNILSADAMSVYNDMDIGTSKPGNEERSRVSYYGIDLITPDNIFTVWDYRKYVLDIMSDNKSADKKKRMFIIVGGTGLYVKALTNGLELLPALSLESIERWNLVLAKEGVEGLQRILKNKNETLYNSIKDKQNARRLIRVLDLSDAGIEKIPRMWSNDKRECVPLAGLRLPPEQLKARIESRVFAMYDHGFIDEVRMLFEKYSEFSITARRAIGYAEVIDFIEGRCSKEEAIEGTIARTKKLAKRQMTWFRNKAEVKWIDINNEMNISDTAELVEKHWSKYGPTKIIR